MPLVMMVMTQFLDSYLGCVEGFAVLVLLNDGFVICTCAVARNLAQ